MEKDVIQPSIVDIVAQARNALLPLYAHDLEHGLQHRVIHEQVIRDIGVIAAGRDVVFKSVNPENNAVTAFEPNSYEPYDNEKPFNVAALLQFTIPITLGREHPLRIRGTVLGVDFLENTLLVRKRNRFTLLRGVGSILYNLTDPYYTINLGEDTEDPLVAADVARKQKRDR